MIDAMVTARMSSQKKAAGNKVLASLGVNASQAINGLYDYLIKEHKLPYPNSKDLGLHKYSHEQIKKAQKCVNRLSISVDESFSQLSLEDVKTARLVRQKLIKR